MNLINNNCSKFINQAKKNIDSDKNRITYVKEHLDKLIELIKKIKKEHPEYSVDKIEEMLFLNMKKTINKINGATRSDTYLFKTIERIIKNPKIIIEKINEKGLQKYRNDAQNRIAYTSNIENNIDLLMQDVLNAILAQSQKKFASYLEENELSQSKKIELKKFIEEYLKDEYKYMTKTIKQQYANQLANVIKKLYDEGFLEKYNNKNNDRLENMGLDILKYSIEAPGKETRSNRFNKSRIFKKIFIK